MIRTTQGLAGWWHEPALEYDLQGRLLARTDGEGHTLRVRYDVLGRVIEATDALGRSTTFGYDELGSLAERTNGAGERVSQEHDARGLLLRRRGYTAAGQLAVDDRFGYDALGRVVLGQSDAVARTVEYDALDRATAIYDSTFGTARRRYDAEGRVVQAVYPDSATSGFPEGVVASYRYDARGAVVKVSDPVAGTWQLDYDAAGRPVRQTSPAGVERSVAYTAEGFVGRIEMRTAAGAYLDVIDYAAYDALGNPHEVRTCEGLASCTASPTAATTIAYDALSRVTAVTYPGAGGSESFGYDRAGNRISHTRSGTTRGYELDAGDQVTAIVENGAVVESFTYDGAGRRSSRTAGGMTTAYGHDPLGRLRSVSRPGYTLALAYDAFGTRFSRLDSQEGGAPALYFGEWAHRRGAQSTRLVHGPGVDNVLAEVTGTAATALLADAGGSVVHAAQGAAVTATRRYEAFGAVRASSGTAGLTERGFAGRPLEGTSGLVNLRARYYEPATGRFLEPDPIGIDTDQLYAYAASNPYVYRDPMGLMPSGLVPRSSGGSSYGVQLGSPSSAGGSTFGSMGSGGIGGGMQPVGGAIRPPVDLTRSQGQQAGFFSVPDSPIDAFLQGSALIGGAAQVSSGALACTSVAGCALVSRSGNAITIWSSHHPPGIGGSDARGKAEGALGGGSE